MFPVIQQSRAGLFPWWYKDSNWNGSANPYVQALCSSPLLSGWSDTAAWPIRGEWGGREQNCLRTLMLQAGSICWCFWNLTTQVEVGLWCWPRKIYQACFYHTQRLFHFPPPGTFFFPVFGQDPNVFWNASFITGWGFLVMCHNSLLRPYELLAFILLQETRYFKRALLIFAYL